MSRFSEYIFQGQQINYTSSIKKKEFETTTFFTRNNDGEESSTIGGHAQGSS